MKTIAIIRDNKWIDRNLREHGWGNGYVAISKEHCCFGADYDKIYDLIEVHGGLTFGRNAKEFLINDFAKEYPFEFLNDTTDIDWSDYWVFGFDTCHCCDDMINCSKYFVIEETLSLQKQLESITKETLLHK